MSSYRHTINLSLVSHTNVGKTTLARTLLKRDIGEIGDRPHVTALPEPHLLQGDDQSNALILWDTPGFGDSIRLAKRLKQRANPIGWFLAEVWDRWMARPLWSSQQAMKNVREHADVVLYLVNASESPAAIGYVEAEMQIMAWLEKPVIVLLNQIGQPRPKEAEQADLTAWQSFMGRYPFVKDVISMDAFARCWVVEMALFDAVGQALPEAQRSVFEGLKKAWADERMAVYQQSIGALAEFLSALMTDCEHVQSEGVLQTIKRKIGWSNGKEVAPEAFAMESLAQRAALRMKQLTDQLIELNGLKGEAAKQILERVEQSVRVDDEVSEGAAGVVGAVVSGALAGLAADLMAGGLTLGTGALAGAVLGGLGFAGIAKGYNLWTGKDGTLVRWNELSIEQFFVDAILLYLAVAHFGRGRGEWIQSECPAHWREEVLRVVSQDAANLPKITNERAQNRSLLETELNDCVKWAIDHVLRNLYPESRVLAEYAK